LFRVSLDGKSEQFTEAPVGSMHYHPAPSPDDKWLLYARSATASANSM